MRLNFVERPMWVYNRVVGQGLEEHDSVENSLRYTQDGERGLVEAAAMVEKGLNVGSTTQSP